MNTLNYWLGKLQRLQLFGHGIKEVRVLRLKTEEAFNIVSVSEQNGVVSIYVD